MLYKKSFSSADLVKLDEITQQELIEKEEAKKLKEEAADLKTKGVGDRCQEVQGRRLL